MPQAAMQTKWDFTACGGILFACALAALNVYLDVLFIFLKIMRFFGRVMVIDSEISRPKFFLKILISSHILSLRVIVLKL